MKFGYLRESKESAVGVDPHNGINRTGLDEYLSVIFPGVEFIRDKEFGEHNGKRYKIRPDYRSDELMLIVEFDGVQHFTNPYKIAKDEENNKIYKSFGYKVVRIPYFIQLTNETVEKLFGVTVDIKLFDENTPSMFPSIGKDDIALPGFMCYSGFEKMIEYFLQFPKQMRINIISLTGIDPDKNRSEIMKEEFSSDAIINGGYLIYKRYFDMKNNSNV